jgi:Family of unknown function (DUF5906)
MLFLDEAFWAGDQKGEGRLKAVITEKTLLVEPKHVNAFSIPNLLHIIVASNSDWVVPADHDSRRYAVFEVSGRRIRDFDYFSALHAELANGGYEAMLWDLQHLQLGDWHPKQIYQTDALIGQRQQSLRGLNAWIEIMLQEGRLPEPLSAKYPNRCLSEHLERAAKGYARYTNGTQVANKLKDLFGVVPINTQLKRGWEFPSLPECRRAWEIRNGGKWPWHRELTEWGGAGGEPMTFRPFNPSPKLAWPEPQRLRRI